MVHFQAVAAMLILGFTAYGVSGEASAIDRLTAYIKDHSNPDAKPLSSGVLNIMFASNIVNVADVDEDKNVVEIEAVVFSTWPTSITWTPSEYGGINEIVLPLERVWHPQFQDMSGPSHMEHQTPRLAKILSNGTVGQAGFVRHKLHCDVSAIATGATCHFKMGLWAYSVQDVHMTFIPTPPEQAAQSYFAGSKFEVIGGGMTTYEVNTGGDTYQIIDLSAVIREKPHSHRSPFRALFTFGH